MEKKKIAYLRKGSIRKGGRMRILPDANEMTWAGITYGEMVGEILESEKKKKNKPFTRVFKMLMDIELKMIADDLKKPSLLELAKKGGTIKFKRYSDLPEKEN